MSKIAFDLFVKLKMYTLLYLNFYKHIYQAYAKTKFLYRIIRSLYMHNELT